MELEWNHMHKKAENIAQARAIFTVFVFANESVADREGHEVLGTILMPTFPRGKRRIKSLAHVLALFVVHGTVFLRELVISLMERLHDQCFLGGTM